MEVHLNTDSLFDIALEVAEVKHEPEDWQVPEQDNYEASALDLLNGSLTKIKQEYKCLWCQDQLYTDLKLSSYNVNSSTVVVSCEPVGSDGNKNFCVTCQNIFNCQVLMRDVKEQLLCKVCNKYCITLAKLDEHKLVNCKFKECKKLFKCNVCLSSFSNQGNLTQHQQKIHKMIIVYKKQFTCDMCGHSFSFKTNLIRHMINIHNFKYKHIQQKLQYSCEICPMKFKRKDSLRAHVWNHTGHRPCSCEICGMKFKNNDALRKHDRIHTGEQPFACDICDKRFNRRGNMLEHRYGHTASYEKCPYCLKLLKKSRNFDNHVLNCK